MVYWYRLHAKPGRRILSTITWSERAQSILSSWSTKMYSKPTQVYQPTTYILPSLTQSGHFWKKAPRKNTSFWRRLLIPRFHSQLQSCKARWFSLQIKLVEERLVPNSTKCSNLGKSLKKLPKCSDCPQTFELCHCHHHHQKLSAICKPWLKKTKKIQKSKT